MIRIAELNRLDLGAVAVTILALLLLGLLYNMFINYLHRHGLNDGFAWLEVVLGVFMVIVASGFTLGWGAAFLMFVYFAAAGLLMATGDIWRYVRARQREVMERMGDD
jgi:predicted phage tail protein